MPLDARPPLVPCPEGHGRCRGRARLPSAPSVSARSSGATRRSTPSGAISSARSTRALGEIWRL
eukprot:13871954-Alexandrium_andersonii.AAC.1